MLKFVIYQDSRAAWRWRAVAENNRVIADGGEGYVTAFNAERAVNDLIDAMRGAIEVLKPRSARATWDDGLLATHHEPAVLQTVVEAQVNARLRAIEDARRARVKSPARGRSHRKTTQKARRRG